MKRLSFILSIFLISACCIPAQSQDWEVDRFERKEQQKQAALDSALAHLKNTWEIKITYGRSFFAQASPLEPSDPFTLPKSMNYWQLSGAWHFSERWYADLTLGIQMHRVLPERPNLVAILNGEDIQVEGYGAVFIPVELGLKYHLSQDRFRPLVGLSSGFLIANSRYTFAEGNINSGISPSEEYQSSDRVWLGKVCAGFDYRLGKNSSFSFQGAYYLSSAFDEAVGGYPAYRGLLFNTGLAFIF